MKNLMKLLVKVFILALSFNIAFTILDRYIFKDSCGSNLLLPILIISRLVILIFLASLVIYLLYRLFVKIKNKFR